MAHYNTMTHGTHGITQDETFEHKIRERHVEYLIRINCHSLHCKTQSREAVYPHLGAELPLFDQITFIFRLRFRLGLTGEELVLSLGVPELVFLCYHTSLIDEVRSFNIKLVLIRFSIQVLQRKNMLFTMSCGDL